MNRLKHVSKFFLPLIFLVFFLFLSILYSAIFIRDISIGNNTYSIPSGWIVESLINEHQVKIFGMDILSFETKYSEEIVRLISFSSGASVEKLNIDLNKEFLKKLEYKQYNLERCIYWKYEDKAQNEFKLIFEKSRLKVFIWDTNPETMNQFINVFCNPTIVPLPLKKGEP